MPATARSIAHVANSVELTPAPSTCQCWTLPIGSNACPHCFPTVTVEICPGLTFEAPRVLHELACRLADASRVAWYIGVGPDGSVLTNDRQGLLATPYDSKAGRNHHIAWIMPQGAQL
jgi:hypothetical protein